jgi:hypothetical protein
MLVTNRLSSNTCPTMATRPSPTTIEIIAISSGIDAPTTVPRTSSKTINAAGRPNCSSPVLRSDSETLEKSRPAVCSPVMCTANPERPSARCTTPTSLSTESEVGSASTSGRIVAWPSRDTSTPPPGAR